MKMLKAPLFVLAVIAASLLAMSHSIAKQKPVKSMDDGTVWIKMDCDNDDEITPLPAAGSPTAAQVIVPTGDEELVCATGDDIICVAEYEWIDEGEAGSNLFPVIRYVDPQTQQLRFRFNTQFSPNIDDALEAYLDDVKCPDAE